MVGARPAAWIYDRGTVATSSLACSVRGCGLPLERRGPAWVCPRGHAYDVARSGYLNLLQPQDRRSLTAGDAKAQVVARAALMRVGIGRGVVDLVVKRATALNLGDDPTVVDLGSGTGEALGALAGERTIAGIGIDLSIAATEYAARRFPKLTWVVANADRRLPILDRSVDLILSLHARRNPAECARVLARGGSLLVAVPAPDDLIELRALIQGQGLERERADALLAEHEPFFAVVERFSVRERLHLERESLLNLLRAAYRGGRASAAERVEALGNLEVTLASEIFVLAAKARL